MILIKYLLKNQSQEQEEGEILKVGVPLETLVNANIEGIEEYIFGETKIEGKFDFNRLYYYAGRNPQKIKNFYVFNEGDGGIHKISMNIDGVSRKVNTFLYDFTNSKHIEFLGNERQPLHGTVYVNDEDSITTLRLSFKFRNGNIEY